MQKEIQPCEPECTLIHTREFVCRKYNKSESTFYRERNAGRLRVTRHGTVRCADARAWAEHEWEPVATEANH
jgi:hypothetical protein